MAGHGVPRVSSLLASDANAQETQARKIKEYRELVASLNGEMHALLQPKPRVEASEVDAATSSSIATAFELTTRVLMLNPEYYTVWNHRRRLLQLRLASLDPLETSSMLQADLAFLLPLLMKFPKCYWIWNHRAWLLKQTTQRLPVLKARGFWEAELGLVSKMLARDSRNFHGWGYRRQIVAALESDELNETQRSGSQSLQENPSRSSSSNSMAREELDYSTRMIRTNLSNFSAWHNRSKLIPRVLDEAQKSHAERKKVLDEELVLIQEALYTDPQDQSLWFYHAFLTTTFSQTQYSTSSIVPTLDSRERAAYLEAEIAKVEELAQLVTKCKWPLYALLDMSLAYHEITRAWPANVSEQSLKSWLDSLETLDPIRRGRWQDLRAQVRHLVS